MTLLWAALLGQLVPGAAWEERGPGPGGLSRERLEALRDLVGGRGCVVRGGTLVYSWGPVAESLELEGAAAPVLATLLLVAVEELRIESLDAPVPALPSRRTQKEEAVTWRRLACLAGAGAPGDAAETRLYDGLLTAFGLTGTELLRTRLGGPLGFQDPCSLERAAEGKGSVRLSLSPRDFARFGLLVLRGGRWGGRPIVPTGLLYLSISSPTPVAPAAEAPVSPESPGFRSFSWWINGLDAEGRQLFPDGPGDLVAALGGGGRQALWILPELDLVVCWGQSGIGDLAKSPGHPEARINRAVRLMSEGPDRRR